MDIRYSAYISSRCLRGPPRRARWAFNFGSKSPLDPTETATKIILAIVFCCGESQCAELLLCLLSVSGLRASIGPLVSRTLHLSASVRTISCAFQYVISGGGQLPTCGCSAHGTYSKVRRSRPTNPIRRARLPGGTCLRSNKPTHYLLFRLFNLPVLSTILSFFSSLHLNAGRVSQVSLCAV